MSSLGGFSIRSVKSALALAAAFLILAVPVIAQESRGPSSETHEGGGGGGHGLGGVGTGIGIGIGIGIGEEIIRQQGANPAGPPSGTRSGRGAPIKSKTTAKKTTPPAQPTQEITNTNSTLIYRPPEMIDCHTCDQLLAAIQKLQVQIAQDEQALANLQGLVLTPALFKNPEDTLALINVKKQAIAQEKKALDDLIARYRDCLKANQKLCPPQPKRHLSIVQVDGIDDEDHVPIDCDGHKGNIVVQTGVKIHWNRLADGAPQERKNNIAIGYIGSRCDDCVWVQFVGTEVVEKEIGKDETTRAEGRIDATGGSYDLTTDPDHPAYNVDSASKTTPVYEATGTSNVGESSDTMFDLPGNPFQPAEDDPVILPFPVNQNNIFPNPETVTWTDHFDTFLVCNGEVCAKVSWDVSYVWHGGDTPTVTGPTFSKPTTTPNAKPNAGQYQALADKYGVTAK